MKTSILKRPIREAVGVFSEVDEVRKVVAELLSAGFGPPEIGLLAGEHTVRQCLGEFYAQTNASADAPDAPNTAFIGREAIGDSLHAYLGTLFYVGSTVAVGAAVASSAVLGGALLAAIAGATAVGAIGAVLALIIHESDAEELEEQVEEGHLLLFVRVHGAQEERWAMDILKRHDPLEVKVINAPAGCQG